MLSTRNLILRGTLLVLALPALGGNVPREDVIWARVSAGPITLDGVLNEADWAKAETKTVVYGQSNGIPGSGWKIESGQFFPTDPVTATFRFLVVGNQLYMAAEVQDESVGGSENFNRFDGLLMALKDHSQLGAPKPPQEYFYSWWNPEVVDPQAPGMLPLFKGVWAEEPPGTPRTPEQIANWDAATVVHGLSNDDSVVDTGYTIEMRFNLTPMGYDVTQPAGDIVEWNVSIYDCDWFWPYDALTFGSQRVWWQSPWGNAMWYSEVRIFARPDVTVDTPSVPFANAEVVIHELGPAPTIDGALSEAVWSDPQIYEFDIRWDDAALRQTYSEVGPHRAGQFQPMVEGGTAFVQDPADATVKIFFAGDTLYMGFDVRDQLVQYSTIFDEWDGFLVLLNDRGALNPDNVPRGRRLSFQVAADGTARADDYLVTLITQGKAQVAIALNPGTTVDRDFVLDEGYTAELAVDLTGLGYPPGLGDAALFLGVDHLDGDTVIPVSDSYGTRTWWYRQYEDECCPAWAHLQHAGTAVGPDGPRTATSFSFSVPNPSQRPAIRFTSAYSGKLELQVFDLRGRLVSRRDLGVHPAGSGEIAVDWGDRIAGTYLYRLNIRDVVSGQSLQTLSGKTVLVK
jgi:hypothetical protein